MSVIGGGRVGTALGATLAGAGHRVVCATGSSPASRRLIDERLPGTQVSTPLEAARAADLVLIAVPDDSLHTVVEGLKPLPWHGKLVVHTSGRYGVQDLAPLAEAGAATAAIHPVMTFTGQRDDLDRIAGTPFGLTAPSALTATIRALIADFGGTPFSLPEDRSLYHAAVVHAANHLVTLVSASMDMLRSTGVDDPGELLGPLTRAALDNTLRRGANALTGPIARGDSRVVAGHLDAVARHSAEDHHAYLAMARHTVHRAAATGGLTDSAAATIQNILNDSAASHGQQAAMAQTPVRHGRDPVVLDLVPRPSRSPDDALSAASENRSSTAGR
ncbi:hypothetical protein GCM10009863_55710 [Streptomyces axinellae]|uniref:DUF2520 domain-containing protein n=1 Tax=Streptomyces axinellae TaxID=552788 RepID=A0ABN3QR03_9ACTN